MSYTVRNTVLLLVMLLSVLICGTYLISYRYQRDVSVLETHLTDKRHELATLRMHNIVYDGVEEQMLTAQAAWRTLPKRLTAVENSAVSFTYFNTLLSQPDSKMIFNYRINSLKPVMKGTIKTNTYTLVGEAPFLNLVRFIWKLEQNAPLYTIEELEILPVKGETAVMESHVNRIHFIMTIRGYSAGQSGLEKQLNVPEKRPEQLSYNPFYPHVRKNVPPNNKDLLDVGRAMLLGLTQTTVYVRDTTGRTWMLHDGDDVYLGRVTRIDSEKSMVEFTLNEGGFIRTVQLVLEFKNR